MTDTAAAPTSAPAVGIDVRVNPTQLATFLRVAKRAVSGRPSLPILAGVKIATAHDHLEIEASDLATTLTGRVDCWPGDNLPPGAAVVSRAALARGLAALPDLPTTVRLPAGDEPWLTLTAGPAEIRRRAMYADDWPKSTHANLAVQRVALLEPADVDRLRAVTGAASTDDGRPVLTGVRLDGNTAAATDSYRLYIDQLDASLPELLIPAHAIRVVTEQARNTDVLVAVTAEGHATFRWHRHDITWRLTTRPIEGHFPDVAKLVPDEAEHRFDVDLDQLVAVVRRHARLLIAERRSGFGSTPLRLTAIGGRLHISYEDNELVGAEQTDLAWPAGDTFIALAPQLLVGALTSLSGDTVTVEIRDGLRPIVFRTPGAVRLLMPMRVG